MIDQFIFILWADRGRNGTVIEVKYIDIVGFFLNI